MTNRQFHSGDGLEQGGLRPGEIPPIHLGKGGLGGQGEKGFIHLGLTARIGRLYIGVVHEFLVGAFQNGAFHFQEYTRGG